MKEKMKQLRVLLFLALACVLVGFVFCAFSPDTVFIGVGLFVASALLAFASLFPAVKLARLKEEEKERRIQRLEEEVEVLKKSLLSQETKQSQKEF